MRSTRRWPRLISMLIGLTATTVLAWPVCFLLYPALLPTGGWPLMLLQGGTAFGFGWALGALGQRWEERRAARVPAPLLTPEMPPRAAPLLVLDWSRNRCQAVVATPTACPIQCELNAHQDPRMYDEAARGSHQVSRPYGRWLWTRGQETATWVPDDHAPPELREPLPEPFSWEEWQRRGIHRDAW